MSSVFELPQVEVTNMMDDKASDSHMPPSPTRQLRDALNNATPPGALAPAKTPAGPSDATPQGTPDRVKGLVAQWQRGHVPATQHQASTPSSLGGDYVQVEGASGLHGEGAGAIGARGGGNFAQPPAMVGGDVPLGGGAVLDPPAGSGEGSQAQQSSPLACLTQGTTSTSSTVTASPGRNDQPVVYTKAVPAGPPEEGGGTQLGSSIGKGGAAPGASGAQMVALNVGDRHVAPKSPPLLAADAANHPRDSDENNMTIRNMYMIQEVQAQQAYDGGSGWFSGLTTACDSMCMSFDCFAFDIADDWVSTPAKQKAEEWASHAPTNAPLTAAPRVSVAQGD